MQGKIQKIRSTTPKIQIKSEVQLSFFSAKMYSFLLLLSQNNQVLNNILLHSYIVLFGSYFFPHFVLYPLGTSNIEAFSEDGC